MRITMCGSIAFKEEISKIGKKLKSLGHEVFYPESLINQEIINSELGKDELRIKYNLVKLHFDKIEQSDAILVVNMEKDGIENYIGSNTLMEMSVAYYLNKKIFLMNEIPKMVHTGEIRALGPMVLNNDFQRIN